MMKLKYLIYCTIVTLLQISNENFAQEDRTFSNLADKIEGEKAKPVLDQSRPKRPEQLKMSLEEQENKIIDYSGIKDVLKQDDLLQQKEKKEQIATKISELRKMREIQKYNYPGQDDFWNFMSEYWLVKNAQELQWDFQKPEYGIGDTFKGLLEKLGYYNKKITVLVINSPNLTHIALPSNPNHFLMLISLPFMRTLDLTKVEISLLMLEDFFRSEMNLFQQNLSVNTDFLGSNFYEGQVDIKKIQAVMKRYSQVTFVEGFNFQQQYKITKKMDSILRSEPALWSSYIKMLNKIDRLVKMNLLYKSYNKIYPSPELQIKWLSPKKKVI